MSDKSKVSVSRRNLIVGGAAIAAASTLPKIPARAQAPAKWRRYNVNSPNGQMMMGHYADAIKAMLKLPPTDARNWYRTAFVHYLDCPHGNWWLLPWHRAITGWMERMVRQLSGFDQFAMPYWDWTADPSVPPIMQQGVLNPANDAFIQKYSNFKSAMLPALNATDYFTPNSARNNELVIRGYPTADILWASIENTSQGATFFPWPTDYPNVRNPDPNLDCVAGPAVSTDTVGNALKPQTFDVFGSPSAAQHSDFSGFGPLENYPHNNVHNNTGGVVYPGTVANCGSNFSNTGGFMQAFLSPTDPLFFLHHSNLDRLWVAWTVQNQGNPNVLPVGSEFQAWASEPFLFFSDENGNPVAQNQAGFYRNTDLFNYDYQPGTFGPNAGLAAASRRARPPVRRFASEVPPAIAANQLSPAVARAATAVRLQPGLLQATRGAAADGVFAKVTLALPHHRRGATFRVLVHTGNPANSVEAGTIRLFGHNGGHGLATFILPLGGAVAQLARRSPLKVNGFLHFRAVGPAEDGHQGMAMAGRAEQDTPVHSVLIEVH